MNTKKNNKGFTLVEIMIAIGLLGILGVAFMQIQGNFSKMEKRANTKFDASELLFITKNLLHDQKSCSLTFKDKEFRGSDISSYPNNIEILSSNAVGTLAAGLSIKPNNNFGQVKVLDVKFILPDGTTAPPGSPSVDFSNGKNRFRGEVELTYQENLFGFKKDYVKKFSLYFLTETASGESKITNCAGSFEALYGDIPPFNYEYIPLTFMTSYYQISHGTAPSEQLKNYLYVPASAPLESGKEYGYIIASSGSGVGERELADGTKVMVSAYNGGSADDGSKLLYKDLFGIETISNGIRVNRQGTFIHNPQTITVGAETDVGTLIAKGTTNCSDAGKGWGFLYVFEKDKLEAIMKSLNDKNPQTYYNFRTGI